MPLLIGRMFLLLLLAGDWAADPYFGQSPLSRDLGNQEMFCHSKARCDSIRGGISLAQVEPCFFQATDHPQFCLKCSPPLQQETLPPCPLDATDPVYAFMSLQC
jgi:hypothetical protein